MSPAPRGAHVRAMAQLLLALRPWEWPNDTDVATWWHAQVTVRGLTLDEQAAALDRVRDALPAYALPVGLDELRHRLQGTP